jgi:SNF2 family DNA or RNA helicase
LRARSSLFEYQQQGVAEMIRTPQLACFLEPGWGKTVMTLTALNDTFCSRVLVMAPAMVVKTNVWGKEAARWEHLQDVVVRPLTGTPEARLAMLRSSLPKTGGMVIDVISYESFEWLTDHIDLVRYDALVIDELSKMKHPGTKRFRRFRHRAKSIPVRYGLTGTPVGNRLEDIWGEMFAVCGEKPLGPSKGEFLLKHFDQYPITRTVSGWRPRASAAREIHQRIKPYAFTLKPADAPKMPDLRVNIIDTPMPESARRLAEELAAEFIVKLEDGVDLKALSESALATKIRQITGGAVYTGAGKWSVVHVGKLDAVQNILDELQGEPAILFYWYAHERERLLKEFGAVDIHEKDAVDRWNRGEIPVLLAHPQAAGHGLNLQHGGHNVIWFSLPWSLEMWEQSNGRLVRHGQKSVVVVAHVPVAGPADRAILGALTRKGQTQDALMTAVLR